jgi:DnaK suppressor protein
MEMLEQEDLDYFRTILSLQIEELMGKAFHMVTELTDRGDKLIDPVDIAALETSRSTTLRLRDRESRLIHKIVASLRRIEDGTFGICDICGEEISIARLKARPVTSHCIQCKTKMENHEELLHLASSDALSKRYVTW